MVATASPIRVCGMCMDAVLTVRSGRTWTKKSTEYKKWIVSEQHKEWKNKHDFEYANCHQVMKLNCIGHVQKRLGTYRENSEKRPQEN